MPLPVNVYLPPFLSRPCSAQVVLSEMTSAYVSADSSDKQSWWNTVSNDGRMTAGIELSLEATVTSGDTTTIPAIDVLLDTGKIFYSADNPPPPGGTLTLADMIGAFTAGDETDQNTFAGDIVTVPIIDAAMVAASDDQRTQLNVDQRVISLDTLQWASYVINFADPTQYLAAGPVLGGIEVGPVLVNPSVTVEVGPGSPTFKASYVPPNQVNLDLTLFTEPGPAPVELTEVPIQVYSCDGANNRVDIVKTIPVLSDGSISQQWLFQEIFNQFAMLMRCCPPCASSPVNVHRTIVTAAETFTSTTGSVVSVRVTLLSATIPPDEIWRAAGTTDGPQNVLIGKFWWLYADGTQGEELFIDKNNCLFAAKRGDAVGFNVVPSKAGFTIQVDYLTDQPGTINGVYNEPTTFGNNGLLPPVIGP